MTACTRLMAWVRPSKSALRTRDSVMSVANFTTRTGLPCSSRIGLYEACSHTSRPSLV